MMYTKKSRGRAALKAAYLLPLVLLAITAFARPTAMKEIARIVENEIQEISLPFPVNVEAALQQEAEPVVEEEAVTMPADTVKAEPEDIKIDYQEAQYPGGEAALMDLLSKNLQSKGKEGRVIVQFTITEEGDTRDFNVIHSLDPASDAEVIRVLLMMDKWTPARKGGEVCASTMNLPVSFRSGPKYKPGNACENPRGVYKLAKIITPDGREINEPFDQYKICLDNKTLMLGVQGNRFQLVDNDHSVFDYTGEAPDAAAPQRRRIYDSDASGFTLKWWSTYKSHPYFPDGDWCIERYESRRYSTVGRQVVSALMSPSWMTSNRLAGTWQELGHVKDLKNPKKSLKQLLKRSKGEHPAIYLNWSSGTEVNFGTKTVRGITLQDDAVVDDFTGDRIQVTWIDDDHFAIAGSTPGAEYSIWQRLPQGESLLDICRQ